MFVHFTKFSMIKIQLCIIYVRTANINYIDIIVDRDDLTIITVYKRSLVPSEHKIQH